METAIKIEKSYEEPMDDESLISIIAACGVYRRVLLDILGAVYYCDSWR